uniref:Putative conserved plasma membrane protein n=1 Tax=Xenopsylla cheopis TaxID=163159 RepID=A0A6M2DIU0_XENCH
MDENARVPVFVFPPTLTFYTKSRETHKRVLSLYNPYEVPIEFIVKSTAPTKYTVIDPEGSIAPHSIVDITVRHLCPNVGNSFVKDRFRVLMKDKITKKVLGKRDLRVELVDGYEEEQSTLGDSHRDLSYFNPKNVTDLPAENSQQAQPIPKQPSWLVAFIGLICICGLFFPTDVSSETVNTFLPAAKLSVSIKLILSFVLGMITMTVLRP